jgi:hypothetical protein
VRVAEDAGDALLPTAAFSIADLPVDPNNVGGGEGDRKRRRVDGIAPAACVRLIAAAAVATGRRGGEVEEPLEPFRRQREDEWR